MEKTLILKIYIIRDRINIFRQIKKAEISLQNIFYLFSEPTKKSEYEIDKNRARKESKALLNKKLNFHFFRNGTDIESIFFSRYSV